jgi:hypothetical protein
LFAIPDEEIGAVLDELELERERAFAYRQAQRKAWWDVTYKRMALVYTASKLIVIPILLGVWGWHAVAQTRTFPHVSLVSNATATLVFDNETCAMSEFCNPTCTASEFCAAPGLRYYVNGTIPGTSGTAKDTGNCTTAPGLATSWWRWQVPIGVVTFACLRDAHAAAGVTTLASILLALYVGFVALVLAWIGADIAFLRGTVEHHLMADPTRGAYAYSGRGMVAPAWSLPVLSRRLPRARTPTRLGPPREPQPTRGAYTVVVSHNFPRNHHNIRRLAQEDPSALAVVNALLQVCAGRLERPVISAFLLFWLWAVAKFVDAQASISGCQQPWCRAVHGVFGTQALAHACVDKATFALAVNFFVALGMCALSAVATLLAAAWLHDDYPENTFCGCITDFLGSVVAYFSRALILLTIVVLLLLLRFEFVPVKPFAANSNLDPRTYLLKRTYCS